VTDLQRLALRNLYRILLSAIVVLADLLGEPCPIVTRKERRAVIDAT
jgi:hypothetical protein